MKRNELISYALDFVSFILWDERIFDSVHSVILFGSVARGDFDNDSDLDLFIETTLGASEFQKWLRLFHDSPTGKMHALKGIENRISLKTGSTSDFHGLAESIEDSGIQLYGKFEKTQKPLKHYTLFTITLEKKKTAVKVGLWRKLYGYTQKVGKKKYQTEGILRAYGAVRIAKGAFLVPFRFRQQVLDFLIQYRIGYEMRDIYLNKI